MVRAGAAIVMMAGQHRRAGSELTGLIATFGFFVAFLLSGLD